MTTSTAQSNIENVNLISGFKKEADETIVKIENGVDANIEGVSAELKKYLERIEARIIDLCDQKIVFKVSEETSKFKAWVKRTIDDSIHESKQKQDSMIRKEVSKIEKMFKVPELIGEDCTYTDFSHFTRDVAN